MSLSDYVQAIVDGRAAVFVGAGISQGAGLPGWIQLGDHFASDLGIQAANEPDPTLLAEYYVQSSNRPTIMRHLHHVLDRAGRRTPESLQILAKLPIRTLWTTNFDGFIEAAYAGQNIQVVCNNHSFMGPLNSKSPILFKMHGTITPHPEGIVLSRSDYDMYSRTHGLFLDRLRAHYASKHFLFIGFSFTDPNLLRVLSLSRLQYGNNPPTHTAILKRPTSVENSTQIRFEKYMQTLRNAYGIQILLVNEYGEIDDLLKRISKSFRLRTVMISGSYPNASLGESAEDTQLRARIVDISKAVGLELGKFVTYPNHARFPRALVSGFGLTVGPQAMAGHLDQLYAGAVHPIDGLQVISPFPLGLDPNKRALAYTHHRRRLLSKCGSCIIIGGVKITEEGRLEDAAGVEEEFALAIELDVTPIPIGSSGGMAKKLYSRIREDPLEYFTEQVWQGISPEYSTLGDESKTPSEIATAIIGILFKLDSLACAVR